MSEFDFNDAVKRTIADQHDRIEALEKQNAKLRELLADMSICMDNSKPHCKQCKFRELGCQWFKFADRMRELGIEVSA